MPAANLYWSQMEAGSPAYKKLQDAAEAERRERIEKYTYASNQYDGKHKKFLKQHNSVCLKLVNGLMLMVKRFTAHVHGRILINGAKANSRKKMIKALWQVMTLHN